MSLFGKIEFQRNLDPRYCWRFQRDGRDDWTNFNECRGSNRGFHLWHIWLKFSSLNNHNGNMIENWYLIDHRQLLVHINGKVALSLPCKSASLGSSSALSRSIINGKEALTGCPNSRKEWFSPNVKTVFCSVRRKELQVILRLPTGFWTLKSFPLEKNNSHLIWATASSLVFGQSEFGPHSEFWPETKTETRPKRPKNLPKRFILIPEKKSERFGAEIFILDKMQ